MLQPLSYVVSPCVVCGTATNGDICRSCNQRGFRACACCGQFRQGVKAVMPLGRVCPDCNEMNSCTDCGRPSFELVDSRCHVCNPTEVYS